MEYAAGGSAQQLKLQNRRAVLRIISTQAPVTRNDIARATNLSKMTMSNIVSELIALGIVEEGRARNSEGLAGRKAVTLNISENSPRVCGLYVGRRFCTATLADLSARVLQQKTQWYPENMDAGTLVDILDAAYQAVAAQLESPLLGIGVASVGPLNSSTGVLLKPPNFYGIENLPLAEILRRRTGHPVFLMNDISAGALAEQLYGQGAGEDNFVYLNFYRGFGAGIVMDGKLFDGNIGLGGEIGHISINFSGPLCNCGNQGCLELYANEEAVVLKARQLMKQRCSTELDADNLTWDAIVCAANNGDGLAISVLDNFCDYVAVALNNMLNFFDVHLVLFGYESSCPGNLLERMLQDKVNARLLASEYRSVEIRKNRFGQQATVIGSVAIINAMVFSGELPFTVPQRDADI